MSVLPKGAGGADPTPTPPQEAPNTPEAVSDPIVAIGRTVSEAAGAMAELHDVFERLRSLLAVARDDHDNEMKIGELFIRAQDHVNLAVADAEERTRQLLADAEREAARIVMAAKREAERLLEEARQPTIPAAVTEQLQKTIEGFAHVNSELQSELNSLVRTLTEKPLTPSTPPASPPSATAPHPPAPGQAGDTRDPGPGSPPPPPPPPAATPAGQPAASPT
jgi:cell division septum initiation protein DivIVA